MLPSPAAITGGGESEYKIDGEQVRRKDIRELFMDTGLGADGYSLVGQGKIDSIISAKNEDRRELFEEAAGVSALPPQAPTDAQRRLEQAQENLVRLLDILGELESRVGPLKVQSEKAAAFLDLSAEKKELEIGVWLQKLDRLSRMNCGSRSTALTTLPVPLTRFVRRIWQRLRRRSKKPPPVLRS